MFRRSLVLAALVATLSCALFSHAQQAYNCNLGPRASDAAATAYVVAEGWDVAGAPRPCMTFWDTTLEKARCWDATGTTSWIDCDATSSHVQSTANPHATDLGNLGAGTLAELAADLSDGAVQPQWSTVLFVDGGSGSDVTPIPKGYATIGAALAASSSGDRVQVAPGSYTEDITVPVGVMVDGEGVTLTGSVTLAGTDSTVYLTTQIVPTGSTGVTCTGVGSTSWAYIPRQQLVGTADGVNVTDSGSLLLFFGSVIAQQTGEWNASTSAGSVFVDADLLAIDGAGTAIAAGTATTDVAGRIDYISDDGSGICINVGNGASVAIEGYSIDCDTAYTVAVGGELVLHEFEVTGTQTTLGTANVFTAAHGVMTSTAFVGDVTGTIGSTVVNNDSHTHGNGTLTGVPGGGIDTTAVHSGDAAGGGLGGTYPSPTVTPAAGLDTTAAHYADGTAGYLPVYGAGAWAEVDPSTLGGTFSVDVDLSGTYDWQAGGDESQDPTSGITCYGDCALCTTLGVGGGVVTFDCSGAAGSDRDVYLVLPLDTYGLPDLWTSSVIAVTAGIDMATLSNVDTTLMYIGIMDQNEHVTAATERAAFRFQRTGGTPSLDLVRETNDVVTDGADSTPAGWANAGRIYLRELSGRVTGGLLETGTNTLTVPTAVNTGRPHVRVGGANAPYLVIRIRPKAGTPAGQVSGTIGPITMTVL